MKEEGLVRLRPFETHLLRLKLGCCLYSQRITMSIQCHKNIGSIFTYYLIVLMVIFRHNIADKRWVLQTHLLNEATFLLTEVACTAGGAAMPCRRGGVEASIARIRMVHEPRAGRENG